MTTGTHLSLSLMDYLPEFINRRNLSSAAKRNYRAAVTSLNDWYRRPIRIEELTEERLDDWVTAQIANGCAPLTMHVRRRQIASLWRRAHDEGLCRTPPMNRYRRARTLDQGVERALDAHLLYNDLAADTQDYYRRVAITYSNWAAIKPKRSAFNAETVSQFLRDKQMEGISSYTLKSLRNGLRTLLSQVGDTGRVRKVKLQPLNVEVWREEDIGKLLAAIPKAIFPYDDSSQPCTGASTFAR